MNLASHTYLHRDHSLPVLLCERQLQLVHDVLPGSSTGGTAELVRQYNKKTMTEMDARRRPQEPSVCHPWQGLQQQGAARGMSGEQQVKDAPIEAK